MASIKKIKRRFGENICRRCINDIYRTDLTRKDCVYGYKADCSCCGEYQNIVIRVRLGGRIRLLLK